MSKFPGNTAGQHGIAEFADFFFSEKLFGKKLKCCGDVLMASGETAVVKVFNREYSLPSQHSLSKQDPTLQRALHFSISTQNHVKFSFNCGSYFPCLSRPRAFVPGLCAIAVFLFLQAFPRKMTNTIFVIFHPFRHLILAVVLKYRLLHPRINGVKMQTTTTAALGIQTQAAKVSTTATRR